MKTVEARVSRLEQENKSADAAFCACPGDVELLWDDDVRAAPRICERCGKPVRVIALKWSEDATG